ncbi:MAG: hypothetical protein LBT26_07070 [Clostridiales Family XIII bacterium]|nr:hypothetical protein [Clostridiales Family XIII bacterium]
MRKAFLIPAICTAAILFAWAALPCPALAAETGEPADAASLGAPEADVLPDAVSPGATEIAEVTSPAAVEADLTDDTSRGTGADGLRSDSLTIKVGYFGSDYEIRKVYTMDEFLKLPQVQQVYTWIDRMPAVVVNSARGALLSDILTDAGIDLGSIETLYLYCKDIEGTWYQSYPGSYLLERKRYYYPHLAELWNLDLMAPMLGAMEDPVPVQTMIAVMDRWERFADAPNFDGMVTDNRFRLVFGQTDGFSQEAYRSAKWIHAIEILLGGAPPDEGAAIDADVPLGSEMGGGDPTAADAPGAPEGGAAGALAEQTGNTGEETDAPEAPAFAEIALSSADADAGAKQPWRIHEIAENAAPLVPSEADRGMLKYIAFAFLLLFFAGAIGQYRRQRTE